MKYSVLALPLLIFVSCTYAPNNSKNVSTYNARQMAVGVAPHPNDAMTTTTYEGDSMALEDEQPQAIPSVEFYPKRGTQSSAPDSFTKPTLKIQNSHLPTSTYSGGEALPIFYPSHSLNGSNSCLNALPEEYRDREIDIFGEKAAPDPRIWYVTIISPQRWQGLRYLRIINGKIVSNKGVSIFANIFWSHKPMVLNPYMVDSRRVYDIANNYARESGRAFSTASFLLCKKGENNEPTWIVACHGANDNCVGQIRVCANDGSVTSISGFN